MIFPSLCDDKNHFAILLLSPNHNDSSQTVRIRRKNNNVTASKQGVINDHLNTLFVMFDIDCTIKLSAYKMHYHYDQSKLLNYSIMLPVTTDYLSTLT